MNQPAQRTNAKNNHPALVRSDATVLIKDGILCLDLHKSHPVTFDAPNDCYLWDPGNVFDGNGDIALHGKTTLTPNLKLKNGDYKIGFWDEPGGGGKPDEIPITLGD